jgi:hypothetical protein
MGNDAEKFERELMVDAALRGRILAQSEAQQRETLLACVEEFIVGYVVLPKAAGLPVTLWAVATHAADAFDAFPYLCFSSPLPRCGKTRAIEVLELLVRRPWRGTTPSEAALFRFLATSPTMLLDELESLSSKNRSDRDQAIVAILNSGYRKGSTVLRCDGQSHEVKEFPVYGPKAFCAIGALPPTLADRSIVVSMQRRREDESVRRFRFARARQEATPIKAHMEEQVKTCFSELKAVYADLPQLDFLSDRDEELFGPLFAMCSVFAPARLSEFERIAKSLCGAKAGDSEDNSLALRLLADLRRLWPDGEEHWLTVDILAELKADAESPWAADVNLNARRLARSLKPFSIGRRQVRTSTDLGKGYVREEVFAACERYLAAGKETRETNRINTGGNAIFRKET